MILKLKFRNGQTYVEKEGKEVHVSRALLSFLTNKTVKDAISEYKKNAEAFSKIKIEHFSKRVEKQDNPYMGSDFAIFYINGKEIDRINEGFGNVDEIAAPFLMGKPLREKFKAIETRSGKKINWVDGTITLNGKIAPENHYRFIKSYLKGVELDTETGKISTEVQPDFSFDQFELEGNCFLHGPEHYVFRYKENKNMGVVPIFDRHNSDYHEGLSLSFSKMGVKNFKGAGYIYKPDLYVNHGDEKDLKETSKGIWDSLLKEVDIVRVGVALIKDTYANYKMENCELSY